MKEGQRLWTRDELILAFNLYCKLPFGKMHSRNPEVIALSNLIPRTPGAIARKLGNFASLDPSLRARNIVGLPRRGELTEKIWDEFYYNWDAALLESENLLAKKQHTTIEALNEINTDDLLKEGKEKQRLVKTRVNQYIFRRVVLATYNNTCCITGINNPDLLIASHIVSWSENETNRLNPMNGLCFNALHDRAFDKFLITISADDYTLKVSKKLKRKKVSVAIFQNFIERENKEIFLPDRFLPSRELLKMHNEMFSTKT